jgi:superfamily II DNA helicase RecQ
VSPPPPAQPVGAEPDQPDETAPADPGPLESPPTERGCDPAEVFGGYQTALARLLLAVVDGLARESDASVSSRAVTNFLRGNQRPPANLRDAGLRQLFGALAGCPAGWIHGIVRTLTELGEVEALEGARATSTPGAPASPASRGAVPAGRVRLSRWGRELLASSRPFAVDVLPRAPHLGSNPELEAGLWDLRRRLAAEEARASFSIFSNSTLAALASARPRDLGELAEIPGFGEARIRKYGQAVLEVLRGDPQKE